MNTILARARTPLLFVANGFVATVAHYATLVTLAEVAHLPSIGLANAMASVVGISLSYFGSRNVVFRSSSATMRTLPRFGLLYVVIAALHGVFLFAWTDIGALPYSAGFILATATAVVVSYLGNRYFVFASDLHAYAAGAECRN